MLVCFFPSLYTSLAQSMALYSVISILTVMATSLPLIMAVCPLDMSGSDFTLVASLCSNQEQRGKCCRYINAIVAISIARYANSTGNLGVGLDSYQDCHHSISQTLQLYGVPLNATLFCGFGIKIPLNYECQGRTSVAQVLQAPRFNSVLQNCQVSHLDKTDCRKCINATMMYLRSVVQNGSSVTLNTCRDAAYTALASQANDYSALEFARCFFRVPMIQAPGKKNNMTSPTPTSSPTPLAAQEPSDLSVGRVHNHHHYHLTIIPSIAIGVSVICLALLTLLVLLIRRKSKEIDDCGGTEKPSIETRPHPPLNVLKVHEGPSMLQMFTYKETKKATSDFTTVIGHGGFGTVYSARFGDGLVAAVKRIDKVSEQADDEICKEIELLARLHHRHLVALKGFCIEKQERFLMYEYMENGSLKDHLHSSGRAPLGWLTRIQIAIDVANALEYLHFYCNPPLCHRDIKSSNILLDENFLAKVSDFGLALVSKDGSIWFEPMSSDVRGTPGYMDPEYVVTRELTEKSDVYSYGVVLLELVTGRRAIQDNQNLVEWARPYLCSESKLSNLVDPNLGGDSFDFDQLQTMVEIIKWCTDQEGQSRPSIKQVLRLLYDCMDPVHCEFRHGVEEGDEEGLEGGGMKRAMSSKGKSQKVFHSGPSSSSTTRSYCSRSFLIENGSPQSPPPNLPPL